MTSTVTGDGIGTPIDAVPGFVDHTHASNWLTTNQSFEHNVTNLEDSP